MNEWKGGGAPKGMRKKVLLYFHDGKSVYDDFFLNFLKDHYEVHFASFSKTGVERIARRTGVRTHWLKEPPLELRVHDTIRGLALTPVRVPIFAAAVREMEPDVLLACWATTYGFYAAASLARPYGLMAWGSDILLQPKYFPLRAFASNALRNAARVFLDSGIQEKAAVRLGCRKGVVVKFPWVDLRWLSEVKVDEEEYRRRMCAGKGAKVVMFNRRHDPVYSPATFIEAARQIAPEREDVVFVMAGEGRLTGELKKKVKDLGLERRFRFLGWLERDEMAKYAAASDIYVSTSYSDGTSASLLEAMALGLVPVVSDIEGNREWVTHGEEGYLFRPGDSSALAHYVGKLLDDGGRAKAMGEAARAKVMAKADWAKSSRLFLDSLWSLERDRR